MFDYESGKSREPKLQEKKIRFYFVTHDSVGATVQTLGCYLLFALAVLYCTL